MVKETCIEVTFSLDGLRVLREAGDAGMVEREREKERERERGRRCRYGVKSDLHSGERDLYRDSSGQ